MTNLRSDSPKCRRIVLSFLDFLNSVVPAPGVDPEGIDVATQCLKEVFKLDSFSDTNGIQPGALVRLFSTLENGNGCEDRSGSGVSTRVNTSCSASSLTEEDQPQPTRYGGKDYEDELLGKFINSLERANFFRTSSNEDEDPELVEKAMKLFNDTLKEIEMSERETLNLNKLADVFKLRGNHSIESASYKEAVELYSVAIALRETNAVYYCNRAAAFTHLQKYTEAIQDCLKAIEINPSYSKAYSRLGIAHFGQGNYAAALSDFSKALELNPNNAGVRENIQAATLKLVEQNQQNQGSSRQPGESSNQSTHFTSFAHNTSSSPEFASAGAFPSFNFNFPSSEFPSSGAFPFPSFNMNAANLPPEMNTMFSAAGQATDSGNSSFTFSEGPDQLRDTMTAIMSRFISQQNGPQQNADRGNNQS